MWCGVMEALLYLIIVSRHIKWYTECITIVFRGVVVDQNQFSKHIKRSTDFQSTPSTHISPGWKLCTCVLYCPVMAINETRWSFAVGCGRGVVEPIHFHTTYETIDRFSEHTEDPTGAVGCCVHALWTACSWPLMRCDEVVLWCAVEALFYQTKFNEQSKRYTYVHSTPMSQIITLNVVQLCLVSFFHEIRKSSAVEFGWGIIMPRIIHKTYQALFNCSS